MTLRQEIFPLLAEGGTATSQARDAPSQQADRQLETEVMHHLGIGEVNVLSDNSLHQRFEAH